MWQLRRSDEPGLSKIWFWAGSRKAVNLIGVSAQGQLLEGANGNEMMSI
jgi:hypothetical protein